MLTNPAKNTNLGIRYRNYHRNTRKSYNSKSSTITTEHHTTALKWPWKPISVATVSHAYTVPRTWVALSVANDRSTDLPIYRCITMAFLVPCCSSTIFALYGSHVIYTRCKFASVLAALPSANHITSHHITSSLPCRHLLSSREISYVISCREYGWPSQLTLQPRVFFSVTFSSSSPSHSPSSPSSPTANHHVLSFFTTDSTHHRNRGRCTQCSFVGDEGICGKLEGGTGLAHRVPENKDGGSGVRWGGHLFILTS